jgi:hypothetical protein
MKKTFVLLAYVLSITTFAFADSSTPTPMSQTYGINDTENWGHVCSDQQIYDLCNQFLIKQFGEKWAKCYTLYRDPKGIQRNDVSHHSKYQYDFEVSYSFSGPAHLQQSTFVHTDPKGTGSSVSVGPELTFFLDNVSLDGCGQLKFWNGEFFVAPYDASKLITAKDAEKIAKQKGYDVHFGGLELLPIEQIMGRIFLMVPAYEADCGADTVEVNAVDGTLRHQTRPIPG